MPVQDQKIKEICAHFFPGREVESYQAFGSGLINHTFQLRLRGGASADYILQRINTEIFKNPSDIMDNLHKVNLHLKKRNYPKIILEACTSENGAFLFEDDAGKQWRLFPFIQDSITFNEAESIAQAYEAANTFACFLFHLSDFDASTLATTIPDFHNTNLRFDHLIQTLQNERLNRAINCGDLLKKVIDFRDTILGQGALDLPLRVTHNDTKINNVLFDQNGKTGACVIDLDTLMPGSILSDYGDMVRTFSPNLNEEARDYERVTIRVDIFEALTKGFLDYLLPVLTSEEKNNLLFGAKIIIYEQTLRFLMDYLNGDQYYAITYQEQNRYRANNQWQLLQSILDKEKHLEQIIQKMIA